ncbi:MAG: DUF2807 domain-containing protein, partial [Deltaproteobacteria bacterium]|nr:DUF2807 domain-containing protein [Nannocystaceae bacterium]
MVTIAGCGTRGDGEAASQRFELGELHGVDVGGVFVLQAQRSSDRLVELQGDANLLPLVELDVQGGVLRARTRTSTFPQLPMVLVVHTPELREVELSGAARGEIAGLSGESFALGVSGASEARVAGEVVRFTLDVSGASQVEAAGLV